MEKKEEDKLNQIVNVSCIKKDYEEYDYEEFITYKFSIENNSDKNFRAIKGRIVFNNIFDEKIQSLDFVYDQSIRSGEKKIWDATTEFNPYIEEDRVLKNKDLKDLKIVWIPEKIIFQDGEVKEY